jgi:hypothetical protein
VHTLRSRFALIGSRERSSNGVLSIAAPEHVIPEPAQRPAGLQLTAWKVGFVSGHTVWRQSTRIERRDPIIGNTWWR